MSKDCVPVLDNRLHGAVIPESRETNEVRPLTVLSADTFWLHSRERGQNSRSLGFLEDVQQSSGAEGAKQKKEAYQFALSLAEYQGRCVQNEIL